MILDILVVPIIAVFAVYLIFVTPATISGILLLFLKRVESAPITRLPLPFLSVLLAVKNEGLSVSITLESLVDCSYPKDRMEVLILEESSTDDTVRICRSHAERYPFMRM